MPTLLESTPEALVERLGRSGLRGRGGGWFNAARKWRAVRAEGGRPLVIANGAEGEPGSFKDRFVMLRRPDDVIEGLQLAARAVGTSEAVVFLKASFDAPAKALEAALARASLGSLEVRIRRGDDGYITGEETALIESLEGKRAQPRLKPPFPAVAGLYQCPTAVNNVETLCNVPLIVVNGPEWVSSLGPKKNGGPKLFCISGHVKRPGVYEASMNTTLRELIYEHAGGMIDERPLKAVIPGGSSGPILLPEQLDTPASFDHIQKAGSLLGSAGLIVMNDSVCMVWLAMNLLHFYRHESCGKCTPCREGTDWLFKLLTRIEAGEGQPKDLDLLFGVSNNIIGKTLCAFGDAAATPVLSTMKLFRAEYEAHVREGRCTLPASWRAEHPIFAAH